MNKEIIETIQNFINLHHITKSKLIKPTKVEMDTINHAQMFIMITIDEKGIQSMSNICEHTGISNQQMTKLIDDLVKLELILRKTNATNRRENLIELTSRGKDFLKRKKRELVECSISRFENFSNEEIAILNRDIKEILSIISK